MQEASQVSADQIIAIVPEAERGDQAIVSAFGVLHDKGLIRDEALVDLSDRCAGELVDAAAVSGRPPVSQLWNSPAKMTRRWHGQSRPRWPR